MSSKAFPEISEVILLKVVPELEPDVLSWAYESSPIPADATNTD